MAERDSGDQQKVARERDDVEVEEAPAASSDLAERKAALDDDIDSILADIDDVLEVNAEEWVRSFVQKGGE
jgi:ubiquitin-like protein Pup